MSRKNYRSSNPEKKNFSERQNALPYAEVSPNEPIIQEPALEYEELSENVEDTKIVEETVEEQEQELLPEADLMLYKVKVRHPHLRRRAEPSKTSNILGLISDKGIYNIYEEVEGWGRLEDNSWIMLEYCDRI